MNKKAREIEQEKLNQTSLNKSTGIVNSPIANKKKKTMSMNTNLETTKYSKSSIMLEGVLDDYDFNMDAGKFISI